jgi:predicted DNA binding CopG/RHH family protein
MAAQRVALRDDRRNKCRADSCGNLYHKKRNNPDCYLIQCGTESDTRVLGKEGSWPLKKSFPNLPRKQKKLIGGMSTDMRRMMAEAIANGTARNLQDFLREEGLLVQVEPVTMQIVVEDAKSARGLAARKGLSYEEYLASLVHEGIVRDQAA